MSGPKLPTNLIGLLWLARRLSREADGRTGSPARVLLRLSFICFGLGLFGNLLWHALLALPTGLWIIVGVGLAIRVTRWFLRRYQ
ncbi:hypothetical protein [Catenulispora rubra]|uniref:hypothetical protein n=1 Tax=Catenulispora rubra TaxID=280293 RepID=UPI0018920C08|nr:hypothetical protein [Catenulispora rubra]